MHLVGMRDGKPARLAQADDTIENIEEEVLARNADFVMELLKIYNRVSTRVVALCGAVV